MPKVTVSITYNNDGEAGVAIADGYNTSEDEYYGNSYSGASRTIRLELDLPNVQDTWTAKAIVPDKPKCSLICTVE